MSSSKRQERETGQEEGAGAEEGAEEGQEVAARTTWPTGLKTAKARAKKATWASNLRKHPTFIDNSSWLPGWKGLPWLATEKMDGQFGYFDGKASLFSRGRGGTGGGSKMSVHPKLLAALKRDCKGTALEGEWAPRDGTGSRGKQSSKNDSSIFYVFDAPELLGTATERRAHLEHLALRWDHNYVRLVKSLGVVRTRAQLNGLLATVVSSGGEGIMIRDPDAEYRFSGENGPRKTDKMFKFKPSHTTEAKVLNSNPVNSRGQPSKKKGYRCILPSGVKFNLFNNCPLAGKPRKGPRIIEFSYSDLTKSGKPDGTAKAVKWRTDRTWEDIKHVAEEVCFVVFPQESAANSPCRTLRMPPW